MTEIPQKYKDMADELQTYMCTHHSCFDCPFYECEDEFCILEQVIFAE